MNISIALPALAPQPTGHPASLPAEPKRPDSTQMVTPASEGETSAQTGQRRTGDGEQQEAAPPSAIQIKIMEMLDQQARELDQDPQL
ncbi:hypothetical protein [Sedimentitalea todarodis]|uniref:Uncharacterized protein n=1 Tax=Sedimentitalea todarodis TaxID=1631240 RepID=A0ABU3V8L2_9RHOB|nr:hypothetical protein [Sedimentitalea todarodis]MDU9002505.1 hypothetical protein [Sedimentitalea todarodis]